MAVRHGPFCYTIHGKAREMGLGSIDFMDLEEARAKVMELRAQVRIGVDPLGERKAEQRTLSRRRLNGTTFREVADRLIEKKRPGWTGTGRSEEAWTKSLANQHLALWCRCGVHPGPARTRDAGQGCP